MFTCKHLLKVYCTAGRVCLFFQLPVLSPNVQSRVAQVRKHIISLGNKVVIILFWPTGVPLLGVHLVQLEGKGEHLLMPTTPPPPNTQREGEINVLCNVIFRSQQGA